MKFTKTYKKDFNVPPKPRNMLILMDGTWNDETGKDDSKLVTNIVKMYRLIAEDSETQISRYFRGIGNDEDNNLWSRFTQGAFGAGEKQIRDHAYATICKEYRPGDRIFIFGFSRGAASARMLASDLNNKGIPEEITIVLAPDANKQSKHIEYQFVEYKTSGETHCVDVEFLGVWDTVYAFGIPVKLFGIPFHKYDLFKDKTIASNIKRAVHLVAIDETRDPFQPTLMNHNHSVVHEIWFPGVHSDVGGGYDEDMLGRITLKYMLNQLDSYCINQDIQPIQYKPIKDELTKIDEQNFVFHFHGLGYKKSIRDIRILKDGKTDENMKPNIHRSVEHLQNSSEVFSYQQKRERFYRFIYVPPNVKALSHNFEYME